MPGMIDYAEQGDRCYLVMEYIQGKSLERHLKEGRVFTPEEIIKIGIRILQIFSYLHSRRPAVYYGDLKPDNLMMTERDEIYLVDFGSAVFGYDRQKYICLGTKEYAAPEQFQGEISAASDIYALGKTMERLCGAKRLSFYLMYPGMGLFIRKCCRSDPEKRWKNDYEAEAALSEVRPLSLKLKNVLIAAAGAVLLLAVLAGEISDKTEELPPFYTALSSVTAWYYSMPYRSGGAGVKEELSLSMERAFRRLSEKYTLAGEQKKLFFLLAGNSEILGDAEKADMYYRQLQDYGDGEYLRAYGMFLLRQERKAESGAFYEEYADKADVSGTLGSATGSWKDIPEKETEDTE